MCGIFGHSHVTKPQLKNAHTALHTLAHRGPNGWSFEHKNNVYVGHRRLSILDLSSNGTQPMHSKGVFLTVNGEIYNFKDLRLELEKKHKVKFRSNSDSEVLLHGYIAWGIDKLLRRVDGMFALAIFDSTKNTITLARDHAGIKPLYYSTLNGQLGWASELKALVAWHGEKNLAIDHTAVYDFLTYFYIPTPKSLYQGIHKLEPAHYLTYNLKNQKLQKTRYWQLPVNRHISNVQQAKALLKNAITTSVTEQLMSDVPVGSFLSGGVDSSVVSYEAAQHVGQLNTCSIGMADKSVDETRYALQVAQLLGSKHRTRNLDQSQINKNFTLLKTLFDEPFGDTSAFPTYQVCQLASKNMTVVLTGDGGDEIFGGYRHYTDWFSAPTPALGFLFPLRRPVAWLKNRSHGRLHALLRKVEIFTLRDPLERQVRLRGGVLKTDALKVAFRKKFNIPETYDDCWHTRVYYRPDLPLKSRAMYLDFHTTLPDDMLTKVDRASMAVAIETRVPLLSLRCIEAAWQITERTLFLNGQLKGLLKALYDGPLPHNCLYRAKQGFSVGRAAKGDKLFTGGQPLPQVLLQRLFPNLLP